MRLTVERHRFREVQLLASELDRNFSLSPNLHIRININNLSEFDGLFKRHAGGLFSSYNRRNGWIGT